MKPNLKVYKANKLIEARYDLNLTEQKLILFAASQLENFVGNKNTILRLKASDFMKIAGIEEDSKNYKHIKKTSQALMKKQLYIESENNSWLVMNWVSSCEYKAKEGFIELEFSQKMIPYMVNLKERYKSYPLHEVMQLNSKYSVRLYELLIQFEYTKHKSLTISVEELRKKIGVADNEYERFTNFENRVIKAAVEELNNKSSIFVIYEKIKEGRRISCIKFKYQVKYSEAVIEVQNLKRSGLANHIEEIKKVFNDDVKFSDFEIHQSYEFVHSKLSNIDMISDILTDAVYRYMLYYYEYTKEKTGKDYAYNYYLTALENDYDRIQELYKFGRRPETIVYANLFNQ